MSNDTKQLIGYFFSKKQFPDLHSASRWVRENSKMEFGEFIQRDNERFFAGPGFDESDYFCGEEQDGVTPCFAKTQGTPSPDNPEEPPERPLYGIDDVEILRVGTWTDMYGLEVPVTTDMLERCATNTNKSGYNVPIKIGHYQRGSEPASGYCEDFRADGKSLLCNLRAIPADVFADMRDGRYKSRSLELVLDEKKPEITALALVGAGQSAVPLKNIFSRSENATVISYAHSDSGGVGENKKPENKGGSIMNENEQKELLSKFAKIESDYERMKADFSRLEEEKGELAGQVDGLKKDLDEAQKEAKQKDEQLAAYAKKEEEAKIKSEQEELDRFKHLAAEKIPPALVDDIALSFAGADEDTRKAMYERYEQMDKNPALDAAGGEPAGDPNKDKTDHDTLLAEYAKEVGKTSAEVLGDHAEYGMFLAKTGYKELIPVSKDDDGGDE